MESIHTFVDQALQSTGEERMLALSRVRDIVVKNKHMILSSTTLPVLIGQIIMPALIIQPGSKAKSSFQSSSLIEAEILTHILPDIKDTSLSQKQLS